MRNSRSLKNMDIYCDFSNNSRRYFSFFFVRSVEVNSTTKQNLEYCSWDKESRGKHWTVKLATMELFTEQQGLLLQPSIAIHWTTKLSKALHVVHPTQYKACCSTICEGIQRMINLQQPLLWSNLPIVTLFFFLYKIRKKITIRNWRFYLFQYNVAVSTVLISFWYNFRLSVPVPELINIYVTGLILNHFFHFTRNWLSICLSHKCTMKQETCFPEGQLKHFF